MYSVGELGAVMDRFWSASGLGLSKSSECLRVSASDLDVKERGERGDSGSCERRWCEDGRIVLDPSV